MATSPESEILAKFFADMGEKCCEKMAKCFADFRPSISRKSGREKFHEKLATNSAGREIKFFHRETLGVWGHNNWRCQPEFRAQLLQSFCFEGNCCNPRECGHPSHDFILLGGGGGWGSRAATTATTATCNYHYQCRC